MSAAAQYDERMRCRGHFVFALIAFTGFARPAPAQGLPIVTSDLLRIQSVTSIDVAKDGSRAVYAVRSISHQPPEKSDDPKAQPRYVYQSHLFLLDLHDPSSSPRQITFGERMDTSPEISPDGKRLVFVRQRPSSSAGPQPPASDDEEAPTQVWIMPLDGGEAQQLTAFKHGAGEPSWSPDGRRILITSSIPIDEIEGVPSWPSERPKRVWKDTKLPEGLQPRPDGTREQIRAWLDLNASDKNPILVDRLNFQDELDLHGPMEFQHLFIVDAAARSLPLKEAGARRISSGFFDHQDAAFLPDGAGVVYAAKKPTDKHVDRVLATSLWRVNLDGTGDAELLAIDGWSLWSPKPSRDGSVIAFLGSRMDEPAFRQDQLGLISIKAPGASDPVWLTDEGAFKASVDAFEWLPTQGAAVVFRTAMRGQFPLMTISAGLVQPVAIVGDSDGDPMGVHAFGVGGPAIVYSATTPANPCVLHVRDGRGDRVVHDLNPWVADKTLSMPIAGELTRPDGTRVQYWLMEPTRREPNKKYPLVLEMHGGPAAMWGPGEFTMWHEFQLLCSWGYGVVYANPRGSGGYGYQFQRANYQDWGEGPAGDVLAAVDQALMKEWVDSNRLLITGGSYAGYLTAWIIAHDHRFKAAVAQRGVYDLATFFGEGNAWRLVQWAFGGSPHDPRFRQVIDRNSPMTYVSRIRTPLLILHASNDLRTGVSQSEMLFRALKELNKPVEYVRYPDEGHDLSRTGDPQRRMDRLNRIIEFFERHIDNPRAAPVVTTN